MENYSRFTKNSTRFYFSQFWLFVFLKYRIETQVLIQEEEKDEKNEEDLVLDDILHSLKRLEDGSKTIHIELSQQDVYDFLYSILFVSSLHPFFFFKRVKYS